MDNTVQWAIIGTGAIAHKFATGLQALPAARLQAIGSRNADRANEFADEFDAPERYGSYDRLAEQTDADVVYIATPHPFHHANSMLCLNAGKAVLCEKPFAVNEQAAWIFTYNGGELASCSSAIRTSTPMEAVINGTDGRIRIHSPWWKPTSMTVEIDGEDPKTMDFPLESNGMNYEAAAVMNCLRQGKLEHDIMPLQETLEIIRTMDKLRAQWGLEYPFEDK